MCRTHSFRERDIWELVKRSDRYFRQRPVVTTVADVVLATDRTVTLPPFRCSVQLARLRALGHSSAEEREVGRGRPVEPDVRWSGVEPPTIAEVIAVTCIETLAVEDAPGRLACMQGYGVYRG